MPISAGCGEDRSPRSPWPRHPGDGKLVPAN